MSVFSAVPVSNLTEVLYTYRHTPTLGFCCSPAVRSRWCDLQGISVRRQGTVPGAYVKSACRNVRPWHHPGKKRSPELTFMFPDSPVGRCRGGHTCHLSVKKDKRHPVSETVTSCPSKEGVCMSL